MQQLNNAHVIISNAIEAVNHFPLRDRKALASSVNDACCIDIRLMQILGLHPENLSILDNLDDPY